MIDIKEIDEIINELIQQRDKLLLIDSLIGSEDISTASIDELTAETGKRIDGAKDRLKSAISSGEQEKAALKEKAE